MEEIINPDFVPKIEEETIKIIKYDYELKLDDLKNLSIEYDELDHQIYCTFDKIYINNPESLIRIDVIFGILKNYHLNGSYEKAKEGHYIGADVTLSDELIDYLFKEEKRLLEAQ